MHNINNFKLEQFNKMAVSIKNDSFFKIGLHSYYLCTCTKKIDYPNKFDDEIFSIIIYNIIKFQMISYRVVCKHIEYQHCFILYHKYFV